ncbi:hypothetical protein PR048_014435 [Dryococelus australis]|uniref:Uncharacterized protein n=1 Tax=Dryococelus australis TaxID=614101 RepID=A0ABQ9HEZ9_9NEOP|nr:hypothetical protein PR048_014435 [Dryococelus australis]
MRELEKREIPEKIRRLVASSGTIPTCENSGVTWPRIEPGSTWWEASFLTSQPPRALHPMRVIEVSRKQRRNKRAEETGEPRENPPTNGIVRHDSDMRKTGVTRPGIEPGSPWWENSSQMVSCFAESHSHTYLHRVTAPPTGIQAHDKC